MKPTIWFCCMLKNMLINSKIPGDWLLFIDQSIQILNEEEPQLGISQGDSSGQFSNPWERSWEDQTRQDCCREGSIVGLEGSSENLPAEVHYLIIVNKYMMLLETRRQNELSTHSATQKNRNWTLLGNMRSTQN